ncbi:PI-PLC X domain-containing protein 1-like [Chironomus tepperi]|uniref:PI-PLC X domain-containing protein 1-like n=1 Tax=Chironomus tepperi TaxID=113505 RepID=UPI00391EFECB
MNPLNFLTGIVDHVIVSPISSVIEGISEATCSKNHKPRSVDDFSYDLENWMKKLPDSIRDNVPIINLAIPGSHNSGSFAINAMSAIAPDADGSTPGLHKAFPKRICCWAKTQEYTFKQQLFNGIRYFDLRLAPKGDDIYFVHGVYSCEVTNPLKEIADFLKSHPNEFVFIDCQKFYQFETHHHEKFKALLLSLFGDVIFSSIQDLSYLTLSKAEDLQKQLIVVYRNHPNWIDSFFRSSYCPNPWANTTSTEKLKDFLENKIKLRNPDFPPQDLSYLTLSKAEDIQKQVIVVYRNHPNWIESFFRSSYCPNPWANTTSTEKLKDFLENKIKLRNPDFPFCTQLILTPDGNYIAARFHLSLKNTCSRLLQLILTPDGPYILGHLPFTLKTACARDVLNGCKSFLEDQVPGQFKNGEDGKVNVFVADFVDLDDNFYTRTVIDLNMKLIS